MAKVSIILPAREEPFLARTVEDLYAKAAGDIEVIVVIDGGPFVPVDARAKLVHWSQPKGLRTAINTGMTVATGQYLMKIDAHCAVSEGFDVALQQECGDRDIVVPSKYSLDPDAWKPCKSAWQYYYLTYPWDLAINHIGLHDKNYGRDWNRAHADKTPTDEIITFQGSCWFLSRKQWDRIGPMDAEHYYYAQEPQEIGLKTWLGGGRVLIHKQAWYAHLWKGHSHKRGFPRFTGAWIRAHQWSADYWMHDTWQGRQRNMAWLVEKFWPVLKAQGQLGGWPDDWDNPKYEHARKVHDGLLPRNADSAADDVSRPDRTRGSGDDDPGDESQ